MFTFIIFVVFFSTFFHSVECVVCVLLLSRERSFLIIVCYFILRWKLVIWIINFQRFKTHSKRINIVQCTQLLWFKTNLFYSLHVIIKALPILFTYLFIYLLYPSIQRFQIFVNEFCINGERVSHTTNTNNRMK